jgi:hypothetical protein
MKNFYYTTILLLTISIIFSSCNSTSNGKIEIEKKDSLIKKYKYSNYEYFCGEVYLYNTSKSEKYEFTIREDEKTFKAYIPTNVEDENYLSDMKESALPKDVKRIKSKFKTELIILNPGEIKYLGNYYEIGDFIKANYTLSSLQLYNKNLEEIKDDLSALQQSDLGDKGELFHKIKLTQFTYTVVGAKLSIE